MMLSQLLSHTLQFEYSASDLLFEATLIAFHAVKIAAFILEALAFWQLNNPLEAGCNIFVNLS